MLFFTAVNRPVSNDQSRCSSFAIANAPESSLESTEESGKVQASLQLRTQARLLLGHGKERRVVKKEESSPIS